MGLCVFRPRAQTVTRGGLARVTEGEAIPLRGWDERIGWTDRTSLQIHFSVPSDGLSDAIASDGRPLADKLTKVQCPIADNQNGLPVADKLF